MHGEEGNEFSRITGIKPNNGGPATGDFSQFYEDSKIIDLLINDGDGRKDGAGGQGGGPGERDKFYDEIDMGQIDEEERQYLLIDKDTGKVYDLRNEDSLNRITSRHTRLTTDLSSKSAASSQQPQGSTGNAWSDWWRDKKRNN